jgi:hypothetical protein
MSAVLSSSGEVKTLEPSCTTGKLVGGGFQATRILADNPFVFPQVNQASSPTTWTVTGVANQDGPRTLTAHAYCMAKIKQPPIVSMPVSGPASHVAPMTTESPSCPAPMTKIKGKKRKKTPRKLLSAGGFSTTVNGVPGAPVMVLSESHLGVGGGWQASALSANNTPGAVTLTSQGICF